jgi:Prealbumin-like fold domain
VVRPPILAVVVLAVLGASAAPAAAATLSPTPIPLTGSGFQGGDGNQSDETPYVDWASVQTDGRVTHAPDDNEQDTAFTSGTELNPDDWSLGTVAGGVNPEQSNILDVWSSVDEAGPDTFVYLAFSRAKGTGTSFQTFELNRDRRLWRNHADQLIPCRLDGDVLISFEPHGNNPNTDVEVRTWRTTSSDPVSGCARQGTLSDAVTFTGVQGAANGAAIANSLPGSLGASIPERQFGEVALDLGALFDGIAGRPCGTFTSVWMHSRSSASVTSDMKDFVAPREIDARRCSAAGTKWLDLNADGVRDGGDSGLQGFRIYADLNDNGRFDQGEPFAISDRNGDYVIDDIRATGRYTLREEPTDGVSLSGPWTCSHPDPCSWTVDPAAEPYARKRDFGNWRPAQVTLAKKLQPENAPGRFNLSVGENVLERAGNGASETFDVRPGTYTVSETAAAGTNAADYDSSVACTGPLKRSARRLAGASTSITVIAGERVLCTFVNVRHAVPSITIDKIPPPPTITGNPLVYLFLVTNTGDVAFPADEVVVFDRRCDDDPQRVATAPDASPGSLDPGDQWRYRCEVRTDLPPDPDDCEPDRIENRATVEAPGADDADVAVADLLCPPQRRRAVQIVKLAPTTAVAGTPLTYRMYVGNTGEVPFAEADVHVSDPDCDAPPVIVARFAGDGSSQDASPATLDPGDVWIYECTRTTAAPGADCRPFTLDNTATVVASSPRRPDVDDSDSATTPMTCPPAPPEPPAGPPAPPPGPPAPPAPDPTDDHADVPDVPSVPEAGVAGRAAMSPLRRCLRRGSRVTIFGSRIARVRVFVRGRRVGGLQVSALQRRAIIRLRRDFVPGRHRATAVVRFQRGAATPTVRLKRVVRICAQRQAPPPVTG